ncbi:MAG: GMC family oxidoreductase N-terminal domain-containing protein [Myxococcota bacterium]
MDEGRLVVVGAGSAGAVVAARVTEDAAAEVLLIESGPHYPPEALPADLANGRRNSMVDHDWGYEFLANQAHDVHPMPRGRATGGSSAVNTCIALRGQPYDYDEWADIAGAHWGWAHCLPAFKRLERDLDIDNEWHGQDGPIPIRRHPADELVPFQAAFLEACAAAGHPRCDDHNDPTTTGAGPHAMNKVDGRRMSVAEGYLAPALGRDNLTLRADTDVVRVRFRNRKVVGLDLRRPGGEPERLDCDRVVLSAGVIGTAGILWRSGIGPRPSLERLGIDVVSDLPVGQHLLDHPGSVLVMPLLDPSIASGEHPLIQTTMRFTVDDRYPNEMQLQPASFVDVPGIPLMVAMAVVLGKSAGAGYLYFDSAAPDAKPHIFSKLGCHPDDRRRLRLGLDVGYEVATQPVIKELARVVWPMPEHFARSDSDWMMGGISSGYHPCGTAPMGPPGDGRSVCDGHGRVYGVEGLYVADASLMPTVPSANLNLPTIMMGERFGTWFRAKDI